MKKYFLFFGILLASTLHAQTDPPELRSWQLNTTGITGYNSLPANVQKVQYSTSNVYVNCSDIPAYTIGPWGKDPNVPTNQNFLFRIPRVPAANSGATTAAPLGPVAVLIDGVAAFNAEDANSYNNQNVWHSNAVVVESGDFDACLGHPAPGGTYHHHEHPRCLYTDDSTQHSPLIGYAFDGYPIYGSFGYANANGSGGIKRIASGYRTRNISQRTTLADGTALQSSQYGPAVSTQYPLGYYVEDFEFVNGLGDLDAHNGRFAVTPEYPQGTYAYYVTLDASGNSVYPYIIGTTYYGVVAMDNITAHGQVTISEQVKTYSPTPPIFKDTLPPDLNTTLTCGELMDTLRDMPRTSTRSGLGQLGENKSGIGWIYGAGKDSTYNFDQTFLAPLSNYTPGDSQALVHIRVSDLSRNAHGALYAVDQDGNDTTFYFDYAADLLSPNPDSIVAGAMTDGVVKDTAILFYNLTAHDELIKNIGSFDSTILVVHDDVPFTMIPKNARLVDIQIKPRGQGAYRDSFYIDFTCFRKTIYVVGTTPIVGVPQTAKIFPANILLRAIAPNPVQAMRDKGFVNVEFLLINRMASSISICNILGVEVQRVNAGVRDAGEWRQSIDVTRLVPGTYFCTLHAGASVAMKMFVVE